MQVTRVTIALPKKLWENVKRAVPAGQRSSLVAQALESELSRRQRQEEIGQLRQFQESMRAKYGELSPGAVDIAKMRQERDGG
jgi:metal-responsive CopG/Arc/MetJ family transcriptional regulator